MISLLTSLMQTLNQVIARLGHLLTLGLSLMMWWGIYAVSANLFITENDVVPEITSAVIQCTDHSPNEYYSEQAMNLPCGVQQSGQHSGGVSMQQGKIQSNQQSNQQSKYQGEFLPCNMQGERVVGLEKQTHEPV